LFNGRIAGVSGIFGGLLNFKKGETLWRATFVVGLLAGGLVLSLAYPQAIRFEMTYSAPAVMLAGLLVGIGSRMGSGCTSGHGICGIGRVSRRSLVAVPVFMISGMIAAVAVDRLFGGQI
ncbi:MAG: YeeE/YedE thiosulfate transporter family protein, partial [Pseudomonadota bacterium]